MVQVLHHISTIGIIGPKENILIALTKKRLAEKNLFVITAYQRTRLENEKANKYESK